MRVVRPAHALAAVAGAWLTVVAAGLLRAESAYRDGQLLDPDPAADVPGRLVEYEAAVARAPENGFYAWRAAQVLLARSTGSDRAERREQLNTAWALAQRAAAALPLDPRVRSTSAQILWGLGRRAEAVEEMRLARRVAPLHTNVAHLAVRMFADAWLETGGTELLRDAVDAAALARSAGSPVPTRWLGQRLSAAGSELVGRVLVDAATDPDLLDAVAVSLEGVRDPAAGALRAAAERARRRAQRP